MYVHTHEKMRKLCQGFEDENMRFALLLRFKFSNVSPCFFSLVLPRNFKYSAYMAVLQLCLYYLSHAAAGPFRIFPFLDCYLLLQSFKNSTNNGECSCCRLFMTDSVFLQYDTLLSSQICCGETVLIAVHVLWVFSQ